MSICPRCAATFTCAMADQTGQPCWCASLPFEPVLPIFPELTRTATGQPVTCVCPICMQQWQTLTAIADDKPA